jgi:hypothetical protein
MTQEEIEAIRRYYLHDDDMAAIAALPDDQQVEIDERLGHTLGADRVRLHLAIADLWRETIRALPQWLRRLLNLQVQG